MQTSSKLLWAGSIAIMSALGATFSFPSHSSFTQANQGNTSDHRPTSFRGSGRITAAVEQNRAANQTANRGSGRVTAQGDRGSGRLVASLLLTESNLSGNITSIQINEQDRGSGRLTAYTSSDEQNLAFRGSGRVTSDIHTNLTRSLV